MRETSGKYRKVKGRETVGMKLEGREREEIELEKMKGERARARERERGGRGNRKGK